MFLDHAEDCTERRYHERKEDMNEIQLKNKLLKNKRISLVLEDGTTIVDRGFLTRWIYVESSQGFGTDFIEIRVLKKQAKPRRKAKP